MSIQSYTSPIDIKWNTDAQGNKISVPINNEQHQVAQNCITLNQIPDYFYKVQIDGLYEIEDGTPDSTQFKVNYDMGIVTFDLSHEAEVITIQQYSGRGIWQTSAKRIYDDTNLSITNTTQTLQDFINKVKEYQFESFDSNKIYTPNKIVSYNGSTFICIKQTLNHEIPTNIEYWDVLAAGTSWKGTYNNTIQYELRDFIYYDEQKTIYYCIKRSLGNLPTNTEYWQPMISVLDETTYATEQGDYAKAEGNYALEQGNILSNTINQFNNMGEYNPLTNYLPKNIVEYNGSTYINKIACRNILPSDTTNWQIIATGFIFKGDYDSNSTYDIANIVYYGIEKTLYECISPAGLGISPYNTAYWKVLWNAKDMVAEINDYTNDSTSIYISHNMDIIINHNLGDYPMAKVINLSGLAYGCGGFGESGFGSTNKYQILSKSEYIDENTVKIYLNEFFDGTPTITPISSTLYNVDFPNDFSIQIKLIV